MGVKYNATNAQLMRFVNNPGFGVITEHRPYAGFLAFAEIFNDILCIGTGARRENSNLLHDWNGYRFIRSG